MLDSGASACVMTKRVMEQLNLRVSRPYYNICAMDFKKIEVHGLIKDLQVHLSVYPDIMVVMDIVVVDVPDAWGMLLSRKWASDLGGSIQMNWSYAMIPSPRGDGFVRLNREPERKFHVEDPKKPHNEIIKEQFDIGNYAIMSNFIIPPDDKVRDLKGKVWYMYFDGASSRYGKGAGIVLKSPLGHIFKFAYRLEFEATNNVAEYEAILLGLELAKALRVKLLSIRGDSDLVIMQLKNKFTCRNQRLRNYRNVVWDAMEHFDALDLEAIPREQNSLADELAVAATTFQLSDELINDKIKMEVIFRPSVPDNSEHWQVFNDEKQVIRFLNILDEFEDFRIVSEEDGSLNHEHIINPTPRNVVALEQHFDRHDATKLREENKMDPGEYLEINIGTSEDPKMVKIGKGTSLEEGKKLIDLLREYRDVLAFSYDELKGYREDVMEHTIPLKDENAKPFRQKLRQINPKLVPLVQKELAKMLAAGIIAQTRHSTWCSNLVIVRKKNGTIRLCVDFRNLNLACKKDNYPLPNMETLLQRVTGSGMMSLLDGFSGYNQVWVKKEDRHKTTFTTPWGTFEYIRMPFGLTNAGATFQRAMDYAFKGLIGKIIEIYQDDLTVSPKMVQVI